MRKIMLSLLAGVLCLTAAAQGNNTIKFLGIPVDGAKKEMITKLQAKGFKYDPDSDVLFGEFNGQDVFVSVQTVNNRVWRIGLIDTNINSDEANIRIRHNKLFEQLSNNGKYEVLRGSILDDKEDISYEMLVHDKRYDAAFEFKDKTIHGVVWYMIVSQYGKYGIIMFYENLDNAAKGDDL